MKTSALASIGTIDRFIQEVGVAEKTAHDKTAEAKSEPGSIGGETEHPVKNVDDRLQAAPEGARSKENTADVKEDQGKPSVENAPEATSEGTKKASAALDLSRFAKPLVKKAEGKSSGGAVQTPGSAADDHLQIGTKVAPTGDDPAVETGSAKRTKDNPDTSHPTGGDISQDGPQGGKNASDMSLEELAKAASDLANSICAELASEQPAPQTQTTKQAAAAPQISAEELAGQAGWELAGLLSGNFDKQAADAMVQNALEDIIKTASDDADNVARYLNDYFGQLRAIQEKQAAGEGGPGMDPSADPAAMMAPPGGGIPMGGGGGAPGGAGGGDEAAMMAALGGGGGAPGGGEGPGPDGSAGHEGGEGADQEAMELAQILEQLGVTPEELEQALQAEAGGGGGAGGEGGDEEMGGDEGGGPPLGAKMGSDKGGKNVKTAAVKKGNTRDGVRDYITEVIQRSRRK